MKPALVAVLASVTITVAAEKQDYQSAQKYIFERSYSVKNKSASEAIKMKVFIPDVVSYQNATVLNATYSLQPTERKTLPNGAEQMTFELELSPAEEKVIHLQWELQLRGFSALETPNAQPLSAEDRERYLQPGKYYESDNAAIVARANTVTAGKTTELEKLQGIFDFVRGHVTYQRFGSATKGALFALKNGKGDCTEYAALIVAMSRATGIPARLNGVMALKEDSGNAGTDNHNNAEVYLTGYGWVPAEATFKSLSLGEMANFEIIVRKGLWTDASTSWFSWNIATKHNKFKEIKMLGHKWRKA